MKSAVIAAIALAVIILLVILNSLLVSECINEIIEMLENTPSSAECESEYALIYEEYMKKQNFLGITVSHEDLTVIENEFNEILGAIDAEDKKSIIISKSRLLGSLRHLRRLSGINTDSIF